MKPYTCAAIVIGLFVSLAGPAEAKTERELTYRYNQIWSTSIRFLRVDKGYLLTEKDKKSGYILFDYQDRGKKLQGSLEIVPTVIEGRRFVRTRLRIPSMPSYVEVVLLDKLTRKLKDEYGKAPPAQIVVTDNVKSKSDKDSGNNSSSSGTSGDPPESEDDIEGDEDQLEDTQEE